ncbi:MAG: LytTR family DNA-binding domain-containing protein [Bacteroidota bacterium]
MIPPLTAIIIDADAQSRQNLAELLRSSCNDVRLLAQTSSTQEARSLLLTSKPDIVFLNSEAPNVVGFKSLEPLLDIHFSLVFVTERACTGYLLDRPTATDLLPKPVCRFELQQMITKIRMARARQHHFSSSLERETRFLPLFAQPEKITLPDTHGFMLVERNEIIRLEADNTYTTIFFTHQKKQCFTRSLKFYEKKLGDSQFMRVHKSHIINLKHVRSFYKINGGIVTMVDGSQIPISRRKLQEFFDNMRPFANLSEAS